jgi:hypothetical protein
MRYGYCSYNTFGTRCSNIKFIDSQVSTEAPLGSYYQGIVLEGNNKFLCIDNDGSYTWGENGGYLMNVRCCQTLSGNSSKPLIIGTGKDDVGLVEYKPAGIREVILDLGGE